MLKVIRECFGFTLVCSLIGPESSCHFLKQSDSKLKPPATWSLAFSRASDSWLSFTFSSYWLVVDILLWVWFNNSKSKSALIVIIIIIVIFVAHCKKKKNLPHMVVHQLINWFIRVPLWFLLQHFAWAQFNRKITRKKDTVGLKGWILDMCHFLSLPGCFSGKTTMGNLRTNSLANPNLQRGEER